MERSLRILDGAVAVLDGSEGVQAQTLTVWEQADRHKLPRIIYVNKMDKATADFDACVDSVRSKLAAHPLVLQIPVRMDGRLAGVVDLPSMEIVVWPLSSSQRGRVFSRTPLPAGCELHAEAVRRRQVNAVGIRIRLPCLTLSF